MTTPLTIDAQDYASRGNAILGIRDSGKTYTATWIAERLFEARIPFVAFDPIGVWRFLRVPGPHGKGFPVVVAGGAEGDLPLTGADSAARIVGAAMESGISLVVDLFDINISKGQWRTIVKDSVSLLIHRNRSHGLRHVFIEEAAEFAPQHVRDGFVYAEMEKLARMGRNSMLGYTLINQRAEEVNKALLELCDNLFLHRQKGKNSLVSLRKWLNAGDVTDAEKITRSLSTLPQGECWTWMAGQSHATLVNVPEKLSYHPDARSLTGHGEAKIPKAVDAAAFVEAMRDVLSQEQSRNARGGGAPTTPPRSNDAELRKKIALLTEEKKASFAAGFQCAVTEMRQSLDGLGREGSHRVVPLVGKPMTPTRAAEPIVKGRPKGAAANLLAAIKRYPSRGLTWDEACIVAGLLPGNGYYYGGVKELNATNAVYAENGRIFAIERGEPRPATKKEILSTWTKLKQPAPRVLSVLIEEESMGVPDLASAIGTKPGNGYWYGGLSSLRKANLIEDTKGSVIRLSQFVVEAPNG